MPSAVDLRVVGVSIPNVADWREPVAQGKWSQFYGALAQRADLIDVVEPEISGAAHYLNLARHFHPGIDRWKAAAGFSPTIARKRSQAAERGLARHAGDYDLIVQLQTLCSPGLHPGDVPYAIYTDSTFALTYRLYPPRAQLSAKEAAWWSAYEAEVCNAATAVYTFSEFARASVIEDYGCPPEKVAAVGAGANQLTESLAEKDYTVPRALFVGIDFTCKGGHVLLDAWPAVRKQVPDAELLVVGPEKKPSGPLPEGVTWVGWADRAALAQLYQSASVFVMPSLFEAWGHALIEAMGYGLPCIGTNICAMPEIIDDGITGRLVPRYESAPLADALIELLSDPDKTAAMGQTAHAKVLQERRWSDVVDRLMTHLGARLESGLPAGRR